MLKGDIGNEESSLILAWRNRVDGVSLTSVDTPAKAAALWRGGRG